MKLLSLILATSCSLWAQSSISLSNFGAARNTFPAQSKANPWRLEISLSDLDCSGTREIFDEPAIGMRLRCIGSGTLTLNTSYWNTGEAGSCQFNAGTDLSIRVQRDPAGFGYCEAWTPGGIRFYSATTTFTGTTADTSTGLTLGNLSGNAGIAAQAKVAYFRLHSTLLPLNSRPPTTEDNTARIVEWKLDGGLTDSSGNGYDINTTNGTASYSSTLNLGSYSRPKINATTWSDWTSLRAGVTESITGSASYSQSGIGTSVTCAWQQLSGPSTVTFGDRTQCDTTVSGTIFGPYQFQLSVTGPDGSVGASTIDVGAVATDGNGVVIQSNAAADNIFGPMIAFGRNPWAYPDDAALRALTVRTYTDLYDDDWLDYKAGTVAYKANYSASNLATLSGDITDTATSLVVSSTTNLTLSFPTVLQFGYGGERVLICSNTGTTMNVCSDGRGWANTTAAAHTSGAGILQPVAVGTGTSFLADYCSGRQGPFTGSGVYTTGTVSATAGSTTLTGSSTAWLYGQFNPSSNIFPGQTIRFAGVISGQPFEFITTIASWTNSTTITLARAYPSIATGVSGVTYQIYNANAVFSPTWVRPDATNGQLRYDFPACISNTQVAFGGGAEIWTGAQTGRQHAVTMQNWMTSGGNGTPNFYDEMLANYAMYHRSGSWLARERARWMRDRWAKSPEFDEGWGIGVGTSRNVAAQGILAATLLDGFDGAYALRKLAQNAIANLAVLGTDCTKGDTRENSYEFSWIAMAAIYDPDSGQRATFKAALDNVLARESNCQDAAGYNPSYIYFNASFSPDLTVTNNSTAVTGTGITNAGSCGSTASGTGGVTNGSATMTGSGTPTIPASFGSIGITGTRGGQPYVWRGQYSGSGAAITLSAVWQGDTNGAVPFVIHDDAARNDYMSVAFGTTNGDPTADVPYDCVFNNSGSLTLTRPWAGTSSTTMRVYRGNLVGKGAQPFQHGIKMLEYDWAIKATDGATRTSFQALANKLSEWIVANGYDPKTKGMRYGAGFTHCEPPGTAPGWDSGTLLSSPQFDWTVLGCQFGNSVVGGAVAASRALSAEAQTAMRIYYNADPTTVRRAFGDEFYGAIYGKTALTAPLLPTDGGYVNPYIDTGLNAGKWLGFHFGVGMAHQWPAVRLGGAAAADNRAINVFVDPAAVAGAASVRVTLTFPSSATATCARDTAGACAMTGDGRQGDHLVLREYWSGAGATGRLLASSSMREDVRLR
jgi:hypothetical protein